MSSLNSLSSVVNLAEANQFIAAENWIGAFNTVSTAASQASAPMSQPQGVQSGTPGQPLQIGQQVNGQVLQQTQGGKFLVNVSGQTVLAESTLPLNPGDLLQMELLALNGQMLTLKLLTLNRSLAFQPMSFEDVIAQLNSLKIPVNDTTANLVSVMMKFGLSVTKENVFTILSLLGGNPDKSSMQAFSFLQNAGLPTTQENLQTLSNFFQTKPELGSYLSQLQSFAQMPGADGRISQLLSYLPGILAEYLLEPQKETKQKNKNRLDNLVALAGIKEKESAASLQPLLQELTGELAKAGQNGKNQQLSDLLVQLGTFFNGEHLINADNRNGSFLYLQIPVYFLAGNGTAQLKIQYEKNQAGKKIVNLDRTKLEFSMTTPHLGKIGCEVKILKRSVNIKFYVEEHLKSFAESHLKWLKESLEKLNYSVSYMRVSTQMKDFWPSHEVEWEELEKVSVSA